MSNELISPLGATGASTSKLLIRPLPSRGAIQHPKIPHPQFPMTAISQSQVFHDITSFTADEGAGNELKSLNMWLNTITTIEQVHSLTHSLTYLLTHLLTHSGGAGAVPGRGQAVPHQHSTCY